MLKCNFNDIIKKTNQEGVNLSSNVVITSDSTTDLSKELRERYNITIMPLKITLGDRTYTDGVDINPDDIYAHHDKTGELPKTAATNVGDCIDFF